MAEQDPAAPRQRRRWEPGDLTDELIDTSVWTDELMAASGIPVVDVPFVSVGGGMGSFAMADTLRVGGVPANSIRILTGLDRPYENYKYLTNNSQIPEYERIRSDSGSVLDNIWGWPSYALREAFAAKSVRGFVEPLAQVMTEPVLTDYYTPRLGDVFASVEREMPRIGYPSMVDKGQVRMVRRRIGGGYFTILTPREGTAATRRVAYRSTYVHVTVGYPGLKFLPDLQDYLDRTGDLGKIVNAYAPHSHVYEDILKRPATVLVRGAGIVASRVLQRMMEDIENRGAPTRIVHLFRTYQAGTHGPGLFMRRRARHGVAIQGFNWPKGTWGGQLQYRLEHASDAKRRDLFEVMGGTTTPMRKSWQRQISRGLEAGWYHQAIGQVSSMNPTPDGRIMTAVRGADGADRELVADYIIDCTGLEADIREHRLLSDLLDHGGATTNVLGKLSVSPVFEVIGAASEPGRLYAAGASTLGSYYAGVDTFLGLQYAARRITDDLARLGFCARIGPARSVSQWWRWMRRKGVD